MSARRCQYRHCVGLVGRDVTWYGLPGAVIRGRCDEQSDERYPGIGGAASYHPATSQQCLFVYQWEVMPSITLHYIGAE